MIICGIDWYLTTALLLVVLLTGVIRWGWVALALFGLYRLSRGWRWSDGVLLLLATLWGCVIAFVPQSPRTHRPGATSEISITGGCWRTEPNYSRMADWQSDGVLTRAVRRFRSDNPTWAISDETLMHDLRRADIRLIGPESTLSITIRSETEECSIAMANAYAKVLVEFSQEENRRRCDQAASNAHRSVDLMKRHMAELAQRNDSAARSEFNALTNVLYNLMVEEENVRRETDRLENETLRVRRFAERVE